MNTPNHNAAFEFHADGTWTYNPLHPAARAYCEKVELPMLAEKYAAAKPNRRAAILNEALRLILLHQVAPPQWLAAAMLDKIKPMKPHSEEVPLQTIQSVCTAAQQIRAEAAEQGLKRPSDDEVAGRIYIDIKGKVHIDHKVHDDRISRATLQRYQQECREYEAKLDQLLP